LKQNYRIDTNRVYVTGLSAGGQSSYSATIVNDNVSRLVAAAAPMSPAQVWPYDPSLIGENKIKTWFFSGDVDGTYTVNATNYSNDCNTLYPGSSKLNIYSGGHCCWNNFYNTIWHDATTGLSVWEWMLTNERQPSTSLPVEFIRFDIMKESSGIQLTWRVAEEQNVLVYEIEKSADARTFTKIGEVKAASQSEYSFTDQQSAPNFYRIKSVDVGGKFQYSMIVRYNAGKSSVLLKVFPTLVHNEVTIQHPTAGDAKIEISSADGEPIKILFPSPDTQQTMVDLSSLKTGFYFVRYKNSSGIIETAKIVKQ